MKIYNIKLIRTLFDSKQLFAQFSHIGREFQGLQGILEIYIKILMIQFCSLPSYISLCKNLWDSNSRYGHQRANSTIGSNGSLVGS